MPHIADLARCQMSVLSTGRDSEEALVEEAPVMEVSAVWALNGTRRFHSF